jgi:hypothetical protein
MTTETANETMLRERIDAYVAHVNARILDHWTEERYTMPMPVVVADFISDKWCRITRVETSSRSVHSFVALADNVTRTLGNIKVGDIHKAAGWKAPAKHARGSVFAENFGNCAGAFGVSYLR